MKKTGTIKAKVVAGVIAAVCAVSVISTGAVMGASAFSSANGNGGTAVIERRTSGSTYTLPMKGVDWKTYLHIIRELENKDIDLIMKSISSLLD